MEYSRMRAIEGRALHSESAATPEAGSRAAVRGDLHGLGQSTDCSVRLLSAPLRSPANDVEEFAVSLIARTAALSYRKSVARLAEYLYQKEMGAGAWAVDIGLFGSALFNGDAMRIWEAGRGDL